MHRTPEVTFQIPNSRFQIRDFKTSRFQDFKISEVRCQNCWNLASGIWYLKSTPSSCRYLIEGAASSINSKRLGIACTAPQPTSYQLIKFLLSRVALLSAYYAARRILTLPVSAFAAASPVTTAPSMKPCQSARCSPANRTFPCGRCKIGRRLNH